MTKVTTNVASRIWRLLTIMRLVSDGQPMSATQIAEELGVSVRTFHRDRAVLEDAGLPIAHCGDGYSLVGKPFLPAVHLDWDEGLALLCLVDGALETGSIPYRQSLEAALDKIRSGIPPEVENRIREEAREVKMKQQPMVDMSGHQDTFDELRRAVRDRLVTSLKYMGMRDAEPVRREVEPMGIFQRWRAWYLVAHCRLRKEIRIFRIDRVLDAHPGRKRFVPSRDFDLDRFLRDAWVVKRGEVRHVRIRFKGASARLVQELTWHPSQKIERRDADSITVSYRTGGLSEVADWVMGYAGEAEVLEPESLREMVCEKAQSISMVHRQGAT